MTLFPELESPKTHETASSPMSYLRCKEELFTRAQDWAQKLSAKIPVSTTERTDELRVKNIVVNYGANGSSSEELRERKKSLLAEKIELYYIYPWELDSLERIFAHFMSRLGLDERKYAAKRLLLEKIPQQEADTFMRENHIQGSASGSQKVSYGLRHKSTGELLAAQQYCKSRWMLKKLEENPGVWEGLRLASKRNVQIHGAATRLQKAFLNEYHPTELMSYVDFSHSLGAYKEIQGFTSTVTAQEAYMWALTEEPKSVPIRDKTGELRLPDLALVKRTPFLNPSRMAGAFGKGVGQTFYGGKLGSRKQLLEQGNEYYHNDLIMEQLGYSRIYTAGQLKWSKKFEA